MAARRFLVGGNWKSNGTVASCTELATGLSSVSIPESVDVVVAPTSLHIANVQKILGSTQIAVAGQDCGAHNSGAFTSSITAEMLKDFGLNWVIVGHSERRSVFGDTDNVVAQKTEKALGAGLFVIACVGEKIEEREAGKTLDVVLSQVAAISSAVKEWANVVIAYEPVWAIGTGKVASPADAQEVHLNIRKWLRENVSPQVGDATRIIYGGSVKPSNAKELGEQADIDGFLVGGASLKAADFGAIIGSSPSSKL